MGGRTSLGSQNPNIYIGICICTYMVKVVSLSNEAYDKLKRIKNGKSFSEVVVELVECKNKKKDFMKFAGVFKENGDEWEKIMKKIYEDRKNAKMRDVKF